MSTNGSIEFRSQTNAGLLAYRTQVILSREQAEGVGMVVRRSIGSPMLKNFDPFLLLDEIDGNSSPGGGAPDHPHR